MIKTIVLHCRWRTNGAEICMSADQWRKYDGYWRAQYKLGKHKI